MGFGAVGSKLHQCEIGLVGPDLSKHVCYLCRQFVLSHALLYFSRYLPGYSRGYCTRTVHVLKLFGILDRPGILDLLGNVHKPGIRRASLQLEQV